MKPNAALQIVFAFFLGLLAVAFVGIGVATFYPEPAYSDPDGWSALRAGWALTTSIILLVCATLLLTVSLLLPDSQAVISNGILLGGVFTMLYAVIMAFSGEVSVWRFLVVAGALAITLAVGYLRFVRARNLPAVTPTAPVTAASSREAEALEERVASLEARLAAMSRALHP